MSNKKNQLQYTYPPVIEKCNKHRLSMRIFKGIQRIERDQIKEECQCCERLVGVSEETGQCCYDNSKLAFLGPGIPLLFGFVKYSAILLLILCLVYTVMSLYTNIKGGSCFITGSSCPSPFDALSIINKVTDTDSLASQNYVLLAFVIIFVFMMQFFRWNLRKIQDQADDLITSPSDYAMILRRLPPDTTRADIEKMVDEKRYTLTPVQRQKTQNLRVVNIVMSYSMTQYKKIRQQNLQQFYKLLSDDKHTQFKQKQLPKLQKTASLAIIIFSRPQSKQIFRYKPNICQKLLQCIWTPCIPRSHNHVKGERIAIERAPEPDDIVWENSKISEKGAICRKTVYSLISIVILGIGGAIQYGLAVAQQKSPQDSTTKLVMSSVSSISVSVINAVIQIFLVFTSQKERNQTLTEYNTVLMVKISFFQFLNTGIFVVLANFLANPTAFSLTDGFVFQVTQVMLLNAIIPNVTLFILTYCEIISKVKRCLIERGTIKKSQRDANIQFQGPAAQLPYKYAYVFKTLWLTAFYAPLAPIVVPISFFGLLINYLLQKCLFGKVYCCPNTISSMVNDSAIQLMQYFSLILSLGQYIVFLYFYQFRPDQLPLNWSIPIYISIVISGLNLLLPMDSLNRKLFKMPKDSFVYPSYQQVQNKFQVTYEMTNPGCQSNRKRRRDVFLLNSVFGAQTGNLGVGLMALTGGMNTGAPLLNQPNNIYGNNPMDQTMNPLNQQNSNFANPFAAILGGQPPNPGPNPNPNPPQTIQMQAIRPQVTDPAGNNLASPPQLQRQNTADLMNSMVTMQPEKSTERKQLLGSDGNQQMLAGLLGPMGSSPLSPGPNANPMVSPINMNINSPNMNMNPNQPMPMSMQMNPNPQNYYNPQYQPNPVITNFNQPIMQPKVMSPIRRQPNLMQNNLIPNTNPINPITHPINHPNPIPPPINQPNPLTQFFNPNPNHNPAPAPGFTFQPGTHTPIPQAPANLMNPPALNIAPQSDRSYSSTSSMRKALKFKENPRK